MLGMKTQEHHIDNETAMSNLGAQIAQEIKSPTLIALHGEMGAGKSVFARGFIQYLCGTDTDVPSPTYTLVQIYDAPNSTLYHFDLYRLDDPEEVLNLDWDEAMHDGICLVEWPSKAGNYLPNARIDITIDKISDTQRHITVNSLDID